MKIFVGGRRAGKTTQLIQYAAAEDLCIVCQNQARVDHIVRTARELNVNIRFPITVAELPIAPGARIDRVLVDDADKVLEHFTQRAIDTMTVNGEVTKLENPLTESEYLHTPCRQFEAPTPDEEEDFLHHLEEQYKGKLAHHRVSKRIVTIESFSILDGAETAVLVHFTDPKTPHRARQREVNDFFEVFDVEKRSLAWY